jgi:hypothetical protein
MHTEGVDELPEGTDGSVWLVRSECRACGRTIGCEAPSNEAEAFVDRLLWSDDARHQLERMPPYVATLVRREVEEYAASKGRRLVTQALLGEARRGGAVGWDEEAERRLQNVPGPVRAMARVELERTALERGLSSVTTALMEEVKARYFGMAAQK